MGEPDSPAAARLEQWLSIGGRIIAPTTAITALLFYFGYVSSRAQYDYFGVDVDTIGLTTQGYVMRSPQPLLVPALVLTLLAAGSVAAHHAFRHRLDDSPRPRRWLRRTVGTGAALLAVGTVLLFLYGRLQRFDEYYDLVTSTVFAVGGAVTAYALTLLRRLDAPTPAPSEAPIEARTGAPPVGPTGASPGAPSVTSVVASTRAESRTVVVLLWVVAVAGVFWATASVAEMSGRGLAQQQAENLVELPSVILDTRERLHLPEASGVEEIGLAASDEATYRYRYWRLRLLIQGEGHMFLVPNQWNAGNTTLLVPLDDSVRVQFQFRNLPP